MEDGSSNILQFFLYVGQVKRTFRSGWVLSGVEQVESVADHMYRMAVMSLLLSNESEQSKIRCMKMSLVHDLAESIVGDLTPVDQVTKEEKHKREAEAIVKLVNLLPNCVAHEFQSLFDEYQCQQTNEARLVKDLDLFDMLLQAFEYEKIQNNPGLLEQFFTNSVHKIHSDLVKGWMKQLLSMRNLEQPTELPEDSNLKTILKDLVYDEQNRYRFKLPGSAIHSQARELIETKEKEKEREEKCSS